VWTSKYRDVVTVIKRIYGHFKLKVHAHILFRII